MEEFVKHSNHLVLIAEDAIFERKRLRSKADLIEAERIRLERFGESVKREKSLLEAVIATAQRNSRSDVKTELTSLRQLAAEQQKERLHLEGEYRRKVEALDAEFHEAHMELEAVKSEFAKVKCDTSIEALRSAVEDADKEIASLKAETEQKNTELSTLQREVQELSARVQRDKESAQNEMKNSSARKSAANSSSEVSHALDSETCKKLEKEINQLQRQIKQLERRNRKAPTLSATISFGSGNQLKRRRKIALPDAGINTNSLVIGRGFDNYI